jgi:hypothetical protein
MTLLTGMLPFPWKEIAMSDVNIIVRLLAIIATEGHIFVVC